MTDGAGRAGPAFQPKTRNICILAHVDHGKTTLSDGLLASNGLISSKLAGKLRYLDSRKDEQERGITIEASAVSLTFRIRRPARDVSSMPQASSSVSTVAIEEFMINLIDSPGHVDFSSEVSSASRLCDGALILVDAVEGVSSQTVTVLRQAWIESIRPILVINKIDRLITELRLDPRQAYHHLARVLEGVNAVMGGFFAGERMDAEWRRENEANGQGRIPDPDSNSLDEEDDTDIYFAPERGNVIFASAYDGWAFRINHFAAIYAQKLGIKEERLMKCLWGDYYLDPKTKRVLTHKALAGRSLRPLFVQFILENIWAVYGSIITKPSAEKIAKIISTLGLKVPSRELKSKDSQSLLQTVMFQWLPLASTVLYAVVEQVPTPSQAQAIRLPKILRPKDQHPANSGPIDEFEKTLFAGSPNAEFAVAYVSKMTILPRDELPELSRRRMTADEMRELGRLHREKAAALNTTGAAVSEIAEVTRVSAENDVERASSADDPPREEDSNVVLGFARLYCGTLRKGDWLWALGPKYDPRLPPDAAANQKHIGRFQIEGLYMLMGRDLLSLESVPAGNIFGIRGLAGKLLKNGTICTSQSAIRLKNSDPRQEQRCLVNLARAELSSTPILRVAIEPANPSQLPQLIQGLRLLNQADPCVQVLLQESGEHVILTAGELHLERCLTDLRERFAKIELSCSKPIVPFRETAIAGAEAPVIKTKSGKRGTIHGSAASKQIEFIIRAVPLPEQVVQYLSANNQIIRGFQHEEKLLEAEEQAEQSISLLGHAEAQNKHEDAQQSTSPSQFWSKLHELSQSMSADIPNLIDRIWAFGPKRQGPNILLDGRQDPTRNLRVAIGQQSQQNEHDGISSATDSTVIEDEIAKLTLNTKSRNLDDIQTHDLEDAVEAGFQLATLQGPLCAEPVVGLCYILESLKVAPKGELESGESIAGPAGNVGALAGPLVSAVRESCREGLLEWSPRIQLATYTCDIQATAEVLGKVYAVVSKRKGRVISEEMQEGTLLFLVKALIPVIESFGFADELLKRTSGAASPQLIFNGYQTLDQDPFWVPTTEEELEDLGDKADRENVAKKYMDAVRKRKGMFVEKKVVEHAEKQRTMKR